MFWKSFYEDDIQPEIQVAPRVRKPQTSEIRAAHLYLKKSWVPPGSRVHNTHSLHAIFSCRVISSLCHRPRNCNFSNLCGRCKSLAPEIVSWLCHRPRNCNLSNLCGRCKSLAPEIVSQWLIPLRGISCASGERLAALAFRLRRTLAPSALALRARFSSLLRRSYLGQLPRIESLTKTR